MDPLPDITQTYDQYWQRIQDHLDRILDEPGRPELWDLQLAALILRRIQLGRRTLRQDAMQLQNTQPDDPPHDEAEEDEEIQRMLRLLSDSEEDEEDEEETQSNHDGDPPQPGADPFAPRPTPARPDNNHTPFPQ